jgi:hypothetical protein
MLNVRRNGAIDRGEICLGAVRLAALGRFGYIC